MNIRGEKMKKLAIYLLMTLSLLMVSFTLFSKIFDKICSFLQFPFSAAFPHCAKRAAGKVKRERHGNIFAERARFFLRTVDSFFRMW